MDEDTMAAVDELDDRLARMADRIEILSHKLHLERQDREGDVDRVARAVADVRRDLDNLRRGY